MSNRKAFVSPKGKANGPLNGNKPKVTVSIRDTTNSKGFTRKDWSEAKTLGDIKTKAVDALSSSWNGEGFTLGIQHIKVFIVDEDGSGFSEFMGNDSTLLPEPPTEYVAVEYFTVVPVDMYRTVSFRQLFYATYTHPEAMTEEAAPFTKLSPLYCAAMIEEETAFPWYGLNGGTFKVNGVSLRGKDSCKRLQEPVDPFRPIDDGDDEEAGETSMSLRQLQTLLHRPEFAGGNDIWEDEEEDGEGFPRGGGILFSTISTPKDCPHLLRQNVVSNGSFKRSSFFRFRLRKGLDLGPYGMALVFDQSSENHFSLVRLLERKLTRGWIQHPSRHVHQPKDKIVLFEGATHRGEAEDEIIKEYLEPGDTSSEPVTMTVLGGFDWKKTVIFPKVASLFGLQDFIMRASAEPVPPDTEDQDANALHMVCTVAYHFDLDSDDRVRAAMLELEAAGYVAAAVGECARWTLYRAVRAVQVEEITDEYLARIVSDEGGSLFSEEREVRGALFDGLLVLEVSFQQDDMMREGCA